MHCVVAIRHRHGTEYLRESDERQDLAAVLHGLTSTRVLNRTGAELLESGDITQWNRHPTLRSETHKQMCLLIFIQVDVGKASFERCTVTSQNTGHCSQGQHVEDERNTTVTQDCGAGVHRDSLELL